MREGGSTRRTDGFSLLEVAVAMAIMAVGLFGVSALLLRTVTGTATSAQRATAVWLSDGMAAQLRVAPQGIEALLAADPASPVTGCTAARPCSPGEFAHDSYLRWQASVRDALPGGKGRLCRDSTPNDGHLTDPACDGAGAPVIKLFWGERRAGIVENLRHVRRLEP